ncbi:unnamed protein product [Linum trigynum]|uniref:Uncharacterized protein n=1 Tax=Linum trigynum TaxID=586398 RepID=A0AAV2EK12_9ROSI
MARNSEDEEGVVAGAVVSERKGRRRGGLRLRLGRRERKGRRRGGLRSMLGRRSSASAAERGKSSTRVRRSGGSRPRVRRSGESRPRVLLQSAERRFVEKSRNPKWV